MASSYDKLVYGFNLDEKIAFESGYAPYKLLYDFEDTSFYDTVAELTNIIKQILNDLERERGPVDEFVIGKTFARKKKRHPFNPNDFKTWKLDGGVNGRWITKYKPEGFDGLIVLCAFTRESVPSLPRKENRDEAGPLFNHQDYSLAVEQQLIHRFAYHEMDTRLANESLSTGNVEKKGAKAYVIYMAFKMDREE